MTLDLPLRTRLMTPAEVLDGIRDLYARATGFPFDQAVVEVQFDTPLEDLLAIDGLVYTAVMLYFGTPDLPIEWWEEVWEFGTVQGLCFALAQFAEVPVIEPVAVAGQSSRTSGAFITVRSILAAAGADVSEIRPSTPLLPYLWLWPDVFRWDLPRLAPGRVPQVVFLNKPLARRIVGAVLGFGGLLFALWVGRGFPLLGGLLAGIFVKVFLLDLLRAPFAARRRNWSVEFGTLYDFRDLAAAIAGEELPDARPPHRLGVAARVT